MQTTFFASLFAVSSKQSLAAVKSEMAAPVELDLATLEQVSGGFGPAGTWETAAVQQGPAGTW